MVLFSLREEWVVVVSHPSDSFLFFLTKRRTDRTEWEEREEGEKNTQWRETSIGGSPLMDGWKLETFTSLSHPLLPFIFPWILGSLSSLLNQPPEQTIFTLHLQNKVDDDDASVGFTDEFLSSLLLVLKSVMVFFERINRYQSLIVDNCLFWESEGSEQLFICSILSISLWKKTQDQSRTIQLAEQIDYMQHSLGDYQFFYSDLEVSLVSSKVFALCNLFSDWNRTVIRCISTMWLQMTLVKTWVTTTSMPMVLKWLPALMEDFMIIFLLPSEEELTGWGNLPSGTEESKRSTMSIEETSNPCLEEMNKDWESGGPSDMTLKKPLMDGSFWQESVFSWLINGNDFLIYFSFKF